MLPLAAAIAAPLILITILTTAQQAANAIAATALQLRRHIHAAQARRQRRRRRYRRLPIPRIRINPILAGLNNRDFIKHYRLDPRAVIELLKELPLIEPRGTTDFGLSAHLRLLATLNFLATGSYQHTIGALQGIAQSTLSKTVHMVVEEICRTAGQHILFPVTEAEIQKCKRDFYDIAGVPNCLGAIDCTHIPIVPPRDGDYQFRNRKGEFSINVQMVCDAKLTVWNICARFPGSVHDARILMNTDLYDDMAQGPSDTWLLGDSGYPLLPWLMTPVRVPSNPAEENYNKCHILTRNTIERAFGVIKSRWRSLHKTGGALLYAPEFCCKIVVACVILHNICVQKRIPLPADVPHLPDDQRVNWGADRREIGRPNRTGADVRQTLIDNVFAR